MFTNPGNTNSYRLLLWRAKLIKSPNSIKKILNFEICCFRKTAYNSRKAINSKFLTVQVFLFIRQALYMKIFLSMCKNVCICSQEVRLLGSQIWRVRSCLSSTSSNEKSEYSQYTIDEASRWKKHHHHILVFVCVLNNLSGIKRGD